ncbi:MAG: hypothetical protein ACJ751_23680 [Niastella sp.]|jgi:hypothetical protein|uniref:hypothetical protein n=1 Tax=Niastella sp. TaxID=1869183 RepID=UPI00389ABACC
MNKTFNAKRFGRLFIKHSTEHYKSYGLSLFALIGVMLLGGGFLVYLVRARLNINDQWVLFTMILLLAGTIFTSVIFADLGDKKKAIPWLLLPASHFEKFLVAWIYSFVVFIIIYTLSFYLVALFVLNIEPLEGSSPEMFNIFSNQALQIYMVYAFLHGVAIYGAIYFEKLHFIKTAFVFFISLGILILMNKMMLDTMLGRNVEAAPPFGSLRFTEKGQVNEIMLSINQNGISIDYLVAVLAVFFWVAAYFRLKEKQV